MQQSEARFKHIMVVDDTMMDRFIASRVLQNSGIVQNVVEIESAKEALDYLQAKSALPEVILLDINMPELNGFEFLDEFTKLPDPIRLYCKVYMLTSSIFPQDREKASSYKEVHGFIVKPLTAEKLTAVIQENS